MFYSNIYDFFTPSHRRKVKMLRYSKFLHCQLCQKNLFTTIYLVKRENVGRSRLHKILKLQKLPTKSLCILFFKNIYIYIYKTWTTNLDYKKKKTCSFFLFLNKNPRPNTTLERHLIIPWLRNMYQSLLRKRGFRVVRQQLIDSNKWNKGLWGGTKTCFSVLRNSLQVAKSGVLTRDGWGGER